MDILKKFGMNVKKFRIEKEWSQEDLAFESNLHRTYISGIELGKRNVSLVNIEKIAKALEIKTFLLFQD